MINLSSTKGLTVYKPIQKMTNVEKPKTPSFGEGLTPEEKEKQLQKELDAVTREYFLKAVAGLFALFGGLALITSLGSQVTPEKAPSPNQQTPPAIENVAP